MSRTRRQRGLHPPGNRDRLNRIADEEYRAIMREMMTAQPVNTVLGASDQGIQEDIRKAINNANKHARNGVGAYTRKP